MSRTLGLDLGTRRIGVAVTDGLGITAQPIATIDRHGGRRDLDAVAKIVREYDVDRVVLGLPVNPDPGAGVGGSAGGGAQPAGGRNRTETLVRAFAEQLRTALALPVELVDESFSTVEAEEALRATNVSRDRRKKAIDRVAAAVILQRWLAGRSRKPAP